MPLAASYGQTIALPSQLGIAMKKLDSVAWKVLADVFAAETLGRTIVAEANCFLQVGAKDEMADQKIKLARRCLADPRLPQVVDDHDSDGQPMLRLNNFGMICNSDFVEVLEESLGLAQEAVVLYSKVTIERRAITLHDWLEALMTSVTFCDEAAAVFVVAAMSKGKAKVQKPSTEAAEALVEHGGLESVSGEICALKTLRVTVHEHRFDEDSMDEILQKVLTFLEELPMTVSISLSLETYPSRAQQVIKNIETRSKIIEVIDILGSTHLPSDGEQNILDEWRAKQTHGVASESFLSKCVKVIKEVGELEGRELKLYANLQDDVNMAIFLDGDQDNDCLVATVSEAKQLPKFYEELRFMAFAKNTVESCMQQAVDDFFASLCLPCLKMDPTDKLPDAGKIEDLLSSFFDAAKLKSAGQLGAKIFHEDTSKEFEWPSISLFSLVQSLTEVIPDSAYSVALVGVCTNTIKVVATVKTQVEVIAATFMPMSHIVGTLSFLRERLTEGKAGIIRDYHIKEDISNAIRLARNKCNDMVQRLQATTPESLCSQVSIVDEVPLLVPASTALAWLQTLRRAMPVLCCEILSFEVNAMMDVAESLNRMTPKHSHIITSTTYNKSLARKHLLAWPSRSQMEANAVKLLQLQAEFGRLFTDWLSPAKLADDPRLKDQLAQATIIFESSREVIKLIAILNVLLEMKGAEKSEHAIALHETDGESMLAPLLKDILVAISSGSCSSSGAKKPT